MKNVTKRDGSVVAFDRQKIVTAIEKAMNDTSAGVDEELAERIATVIQDMDKDASVEEIQDMVEDNLMSSDRKDVARSYIIYRDAHARRRHCGQRDFLRRRWHRFRAGGCRCMARRF